MPKQPMLPVLLAAFAVAVRGHGRALPINPDLGVPGYPDCVRPAELGTARSVDAAAMELQCF
jgi:hypothetical protein